MGIGFFIGGTVATNDKLIKDLVIKVKAGDLTSAATSATKLSTALENAASGGELLDESIKRVPSTLKTAVDRATELKNSLNSKISNSLVGQFSLVSSELKSVTSQLEVISKLSAKSINFKGLNTASSQANKMAINLLEAGVAAQMAAIEMTSISLSLVEANNEAFKLAGTLGEIGSAGGIDKIDVQLNRLNDTLELVLGEIISMGEGMDRSADLMIDRLGDINAGTELVRRESKRTSQSLGGLSDSFDNVNGAARTANDALKNSGSHAQGATRQFSALARMGGTLSIAYAMVAANVYAIKSAWDYVAKGDALMRMEKASNDLAATSGVVLNDMVNMIQEVSGFSIDYETAMRTAAAATIYGFDTKTIENFTKIARGAAQVLGGDMTDFMNRLVKGTAKQERELLDELGIMVRVDKAQEDYAASIGKTVNQLTGLQKTQAFANGVSKNGLELYGDLGETLSQTSPIERASAATSTLVRELSELIAVTASPIVIEIITKSDETKAMDKAILSFDKLKQLQKQTGAQEKNGKNIQALNLLNQTLETQVKLRDEVLEAQNKLVQASTEMKSFGEPGWMKDAALTVLAGNTIGGATTKMKLYAMEVQSLNEKLAASEEVSKNVFDSLAFSFGVLPEDLKKVVGGFSAVNTQVVSSGKTMTTIASEIDKANTALKLTTTTSSTLADNFEQTQNEVKALEGTLTNVAVKALPKLAEQIRNAISKAISGVGADSKEQLVVLQKVYADQAKFDKEASQRSKEIAEAGAKSLDFNINSLSTNAKNIDINKQALALADARLAVNAKDEEALKIHNESLAQIVSLSQERKELDYSIGQQAIDNANATKAATIMLQDQTDATKNRLDAENALATAKKKVASAGTASDSASAINARAQAEVAFKEALLDEAAANDAIISKQKILAAYQSDTEAYMKGHISNQASIVTAQREYVDATAELARLDSDGVKKEERRLELLQQQVQAKKTISELTAEQILSDIERKQRGSSRGDTGTISMAKREMDEAKARMEGLAKNATTFGTVNYENAVEEFKQAKYEYEKAQETRTREGTNTALGAMGSSSISSVQGLKGQDREDVLSADALSNYTDALDTIASYNPAMTDMITNMGQLTNSFIAFGQGAVTASQLVAPVLNTISSAMTASSQSAIDDISNQIEMEKKLDGNSEKSKAKIAKLEAEKAAKEKKMAQQTIITQTAVGMAQALGSMPYPYNLVAMGTVAAAGLMALKQAQSGSSIATSTASAPESLSLGERSNRVDTSIAASMGESSYIRGDQGTGSIQNFTPRASGGKAYAGTTILAGENGPEPITLGADAMVTSNSNAKKQGNKAAVAIHINAVDARSFQDLLATDPAFITGLVEATLNERGGSLGY